MITRINTLISIMTFFQFLSDITTLHFPVILYTVLAVVLITYIVHTIIEHVLRRDNDTWSDKYMEEFGPGTRRLSKYEELHLFVGRFSHINLTNALIIRSKQPLGKSLVHEALLRLAKRHPLLRSRIVEDKAKNCFYFKPMDVIKVNLSVDESGDWKSIAEEQLRVVHNVESGPLWRVVFLPNTSYKDEIQSDYVYESACVFGFSHVGIDGTSYMRLFGEFVDALNDAMNNVPADIKPFDILPPLDAYLGPSPKQSFLQKIRRAAILLLTNFPGFFTKLIQRNATPPPFVKNNGLERERNPDATKKSCIVPVELSEQQTSHMLKACKEHKVTVHGVVQAAACIAYAELSQGGRLSSPTMLVAGPTVNMRPHIEATVPADYVGCYYSLIFMKNHIEPGMSIWDLAKTVSTFIHKSIAEQVPSKIAYYFISLLEIVKNVPALMTPPDPIDRMDDMHFTNLGNVSFLNRGSDRAVKLSARFGCSSEFRQGAIFSVNLATFNGKVFLTCGYYPHVTNKTVAEKFANMLIQKLSNL